MRALRISILAAVTAGVVLAIGAGWSFAAHTTGQVGYGAPQVLGDQFIKPNNSSSSGLGLWLGLLIATGILGASAFFGWYRTHHAGAQP